MKKLLLLLCGIGLATTMHAQNFAIKSNILYDATTTINLGIEFALADQWTMDISGNYNPWTFPQKVKVNGVIDPAQNHDAKIKHWMVQPEVRWWTCEKFHGHYFGLHAHYAQYNFGGLTFLPDGWADGSDGTDGLQNKRFEGWLVGGGLSYGYHWILSNRFSLEFSIGAGYAYLNYDKYPCAKCSTIESSKYMHYFGPTKAGITAVFMLK